MKDTMCEIVETDARGEILLPGRPNEQFTMRENNDGSILLSPVDSNSAQQEYDAAPELQELLHLASESVAVQRTRQRAIRP